MVRWDGRNGHLVPVRNLGRRLRAAGRDPGPGRSSAAPRPPGDGGGERPSTARSAPGPLGRWSEERAPPELGADPSGSGASQRSGRQPPGTRAPGRWSRRSRHRRAHGTAALGSAQIGAAACQPLRGRLRAGSAGAWHRSAPRSWRGKPVGYSGPPPFSAMDSTLASGGRARPTGGRSLGLLASRPRGATPMSTSHPDNRTAAHRRRRCGWPARSLASSCTAPATTTTNRSSSRRPRPRPRRERPARRPASRRAAASSSTAWRPRPAAGYCLPEAAAGHLGHRRSRGPSTTRSPSPTARAATSRTWPSRSTTTTPTRSGPSRCAPGITFHDGSKLDATVVKNNLDAYRGAVRRPRARCCSPSCSTTSPTVDVVNELTVRVTTEDAVGGLPRRALQLGPRSAIVAQAQLDADPRTLRHRARSAPARSSSCPGRRT